MTESPRPAMLRRAELRVAKIWNETHDTKTFRIAAPAGGLPSFRPGQFYALEVMGPDGAWIRRSYSIASSPLETAHFDLTIKFLEGGAATGVLFQQIQEGGIVRATGPFGEFVLEEEKPAIFVAGGVGVTPMMSMLRFLAASPAPPPVCMLYSNRARRDIIYDRELAEIQQKHPVIQIYHSLTRPDAGDGWTGRRGRFDAAAIRELCGNMTDRIAYLCGPVSMMEECGRELLNSGVPAANIRTEAFLGTSPTFGG